MEGPDRSLPGSETPPGTAPGSETPLRDALRPAGPPRFGVSARDDHERILVRVEGELDLLTVPRLAAQLNGLIRTRPRDVYLDLREVGFIDSAGLQLLLNTRRRLLGASRTLTVICREGPVRRVIELARLTETLRVVAE
jgi:anti-sigma B factor antagonist